jgi:hypothetical protein
MNFRKVNNITGLIVGLIACATYILTREASGSFWDCGEFVSSAYKVQLPHPPGAPLFVLIGRLFIILFGDNPNNAARAVNVMSAMASGATILFLFWTITHFARKMFVTVGETLSDNQIVTVMAAGVVGALAYCFSDSFWFSAVEGEVYGLSSFFTALAFWAMLKWEHADERAGNNEAARNRADRWIVFIFFSLGLSIGVHLLGLLTVPAIVMIYYFRRYKYTLWGAILAFVIACVITGLVQVVIIQYSMKAAGIVDIFFVNNLHLGFFSGFAFYFIALAALIAIGLRFTDRKVTHTKLAIWLAGMFILLLLPFITKGDSNGARIVKILFLIGLALITYLFKLGRTRGIKLALWSYAFMMLGYSTYFTTLIRSNANPSIDMNNVDNPMSLVYYLSREQYGEAPLVYGPHFAVDPQRDVVQDDPYVEGEMKYVKGKNKYIAIGKDKDYHFNSDVMQVFPRIWDRSNDQDHANFYASWEDLYDTDASGKRIGYKAPTYGDNMHWFFTYQLGLMYWRYFMWNFAGKQNDVQGFGNARDGNWITGISFIDNAMLGDQSKMPDSSNHNKAHNKLYLLPFLLGILGCVFQFLQNRRDWIVNFLLFFFTGIAVVLYLNQPGNQPRERDYAFVGSFYAFAVWIGLALPALVKLVRERENKTIFTNTLLFGAVLSFFIVLMSGSWHSKGAFILAPLATAVLYAVFAGGLTYIIRALSSAGQNYKMMNIIISVVCMIVPILMAQQEWDDHDRSKKRLARDVAKDYLESCAPNAILITFGDNDTYPLWYAQEVEGVRPDIRIINNSLLGIDWYINQLRYKVNQSDPIDVIWTPEQIEGHNREYLFFQPDQRISQDRYYPLYDVMKNVLGAPLPNEEGRDEGPQSFPVRRFTVPVDTALVRKNGTVDAGDTVLPEMKFEIPLQGNRLALTRSDWITLNIIAANNWKRPIYFTSPISNLGFYDYLRKDGLTYRLVPAKTKSTGERWVLRGFTDNDNIDTLYRNVMEKFEYTSKRGAYFDEENRRHALNIRLTYAEAAGNMADAGKKDEGLKALQKAENDVNNQDLPYAMISNRGNNHNVNGLFYLEACYKAGNMKLAEAVKGALKKDLEQQVAYFNYLKSDREDFYSQFYDQGEVDRTAQLLQLISVLEDKYNPKTPVNRIETPTTPVINNANRAADTPKKR